MSNTANLPGKRGMSHSLDLLSDTYNYNHWIYSVMRPYIGNKVVEVGSGPGNITRFLLSCQQLVCIEPDPDFIEDLEKLCKVHANISVVNRLLDDIRPADLPGWPYDTVLSANVLEHIEDDLGALRTMHDMLDAGGRKLLFVPAVPWAYGEMDRELGHFRRYSRRSLLELFAAAGFSKVRARYFNTIGLFGWWYAGRMRRERLIDPRKARAMDRMVPYLSALERMVPPLIGQSLLCVAEK